MILTDQGAYSDSNQVLKKVAQSLAPEVSQGAELGKVVVQRGKKVKHKNSFQYIFIFLNLLIYQNSHSISSMTIFVSNANVKLSSASVLSADATTALAPSTVDA